MKQKEHINSYYRKAKSFTNLVEMVLFIGLVIAIIIT
jgi:hypothetical protein